MRTNEDPTPERFQPLGEKVQKKYPLPPTPVPDSHGPYGVVTGTDGKMYTTRNPLQR